MNIYDEVHRLVKKYVAKGERLLLEQGKGPGKELTVDLTRRRSTTGGYAWSTQWKIWINPHLHELHPEELEDTVGHEIAHVYGWHALGAHGHDHNWKKTMRYFGLEPRRCHSMKKAALAGKNKTIHLYSCESCGHEFKIGASRHNKMRRGIKYFHPKCHTKGNDNGKLVYVRTTNKHALAKEKLGMDNVLQAAARNPAPKKKPSLKRSIDITGTDRPKTKAGKAEQIFRMNRHLPRQDMISVFMDHLKMTKAGASTYYYNIKRKYS